LPERGILGLRSRSNRSARRRHRIERARQDVAISVPTLLVDDC
jgi:hypothetical protein